MKKIQVKTEAEKILEREMEKKEVEALFSFLLLAHRENEEKQKEEISKLEKQMDEEVKKVISKFNSKIEEKEKNFLQKMISNALTILKIKKAESKKFLKENESEDEKKFEEKSELVQDENQEKGFGFWDKNFKHN
ncbi:hypothetical protein N5T90_06560 [Aliarcobacter cryaerophilus]|uniref:hypothetical protein n=1 Tax=Aliarcobacter cryaerophilus TaxID=28198 RepID=UPI0021B531CA|nr:hypothetical protein [Aliarcobacter cryaerophilus]MCT7470530.1 hypothetical protein [Aliarcobacter cryaerophilus]